MQLQNSIENHEEIVSQTFETCVKKEEFLEEVRVQFESGIKDHKDIDYFDNSECEIKEEIYNEKLAEFAKYASEGMFDSYDAQDFAAKDFNVETNNDKQELEAMDDNEETNNDNQDLEATDENEESCEEVQIKIGKFNYYFIKKACHLSRLFFLPYHFPMTSNGSYWQNYRIFMM